MEGDLRAGKVAVMWAMMVRGSPENKKVMYGRYSIEGGKDRGDAGAMTVRDSPENKKEQKKLRLPALST